jgi:hypothetical protein
VTLRLNQSAKLEGRMEYVYDIQYPERSAVRAKASIVDGSFRG